MPIENVAELIAETLIQAGVKRIFGVVGDSLNGLTEALRQRWHTPHNREIKPR